MRPVFVLVCAAACSAPDPDPIASRQIPKALAADVEAIAQGNNAFASDLYAQLRQTPGNLFFSPFSIATALSMADAGAAGNTDAQLRAALHAALPADQQHAAFGALLDSLDRGLDYGNYALATANRLYGQTGNNFLPAFLDITREDYNAELATVDFANAPAAATAEINAWVAEQTEQVVPVLFDDELSTDTRMAVVNAIYFKGAWDLVFEPASPRPFQLADGSTIDVPMMQKEDAIGVATLDGDGHSVGQLGALPFRGKDISMIVLLPNAHDQLPQLEAAMTGSKLASWLAAPRQIFFDDTPISLPKFQLASSYDLIPNLRALGILDAYTPAADLSNMTGDRELVLGSTVHAARISVDEQGAEAAAASGAGGDIVSAPAPFVVDRPFLFLIYDEVTHSVLFMGRVERP